MLAASIPSELRQVCMCKGFGTTLTGPALQWYINLSNGSIKSFTDLINSFNHQFANSKELEKRSSDLYRIKQKPGETIRAFLTRFNKEKVSIPRCDIGTAMEAFRQGLPLDSDFYDELSMKPCLTFEDVQAKAIGYIKMEEDKSFKAETIDIISGEERSNIKSFNHRGSSSRPSPYTRPDRSEVNYAHEQRGKAADQERPQRDLPPTPPIYEVKLINGGSEICGLTSSEISDIHHDGLVITMQIGTVRVLRILVDSGSSVNLIMLDVLKAMKIDENQIIKKSNVLVGFSGETKNTLGRSTCQPTLKESHHMKDLESWIAFHPTTQS
ncbi:uncharacterized protein LOC141640791 [Silene latifolia]|uniref:uncharacterized protein LOC141640791 n=1 Tax=Silene latifolia TaxID=37657 RepID=UPI003D774300